MIGQTISHYKIIEKLGEGGMGVVYKAHDTNLDRTVALKFLPHHITSTADEQVRFVQEAKAAAALNHPNICTIYGIEEANGKTFIIMEYIDGKTLRQKIGEGNLQIKDCVEYAIQIGEALAEAHSKGVVHRDIKSENIMVNSKNQVKVMDFGLAKLKGTLKITRSSSTIGTLAYMSPEQIQGGEVDTRSDIFSFGVVLYEMLTGHLPFRGEHEAAILYSIVNEEPIPIQKYLPDISSEMQHILNRVLEKDPEERYQTIHDMVIDMRRMKKVTIKTSPLSPNIQSSLGSSESVVISTENPLSKSMKSWKWIVSIGLIILVIAVSAILFLWNKKETIDSLAVLPFSYKGNDINIDILAEEIPGAIIEKLNELANIKVRSRSTTLRYRSSQKEPQEIGKELGVHAVLTGSVELRNENIIVRVELSNVNEGYQIWGPHDYKEKLSDIYLIQEKIAKDVAENLRIKISKAEQEKLVSRSTENAEAYKNYLLGLHFRYLETYKSVEKAISYFQLAIEKDPNHALAYAGLAEVYLFHDDDLRRCTAAAQRAFELDPKAPETNIALGIIREFEWDWSGAEKLFRNAIEINPKYWNAHRELGYLYFRTGKLEEAEKEALLSLELEPLATQPYSLLGLIYSSMGKHSMAAEEFKKASEINFKYNAISLGYEYLMLGQYEQARDVFMKAGSKMIALYYAAVGKKEEVFKQIDSVQNRLENPKRAFYLALIYSYLGENSKALDQLESLIQQTPSFYIDLKVDSWFSNLHSEPRFVALLKKMGLEK